MKKISLLATVCLLSVPAQAQQTFSFDINGHKVHVEVRKNCGSDRCVNVTTDKGAADKSTADKRASDKGTADKDDDDDQPRLGQRLGDLLSRFRSMRRGADTDRDDDQTDQPAATAPAVPPAAAVTEAPKTTPAPVATPAPAVGVASPAVARPAATIAAPPPAKNATAVPPASAVPSAAPPQPVASGAAPVTPATPTAAVPAPAVATVAPAAAAPAVVPAAPVVAATPPAATDESPVGIWLTQNKEGKVHIVQCGEFLCGYVFDSAAKRDGTQIIIDMKKSETQKKWSGQVHDPKGGGNYDATIVLKGHDTLAIRGCAFGFICKKQTWSRV